MWIERRASSFLTDAFVTLSRIGDERQWWSRDQRRKPVDGVVPTIPFLMGSVMGRTLAAGFERPGDAVSGLSGDRMECAGRGSHRISVSEFSIGVGEIVILAATLYKCVTPLVAGLPTEPPTPTPTPTPTAGLPFSGEQRDAVSPSKPVRSQETVAKQSWRHPPG